MVFDRVRSWYNLTSFPIHSIPSICTLGVFTELMRGIGVQGAQVEEVYSLDPESLSFLP